MAALFDKQVFVKTVPVLALKVVASAAATLREKLGKYACRILHVVFIRFGLVEGRW